MLSPASDRIQVRGAIFWHNDEFPSNHDTSDRYRATHDTSSGKGVEDEPAGSSVRCRGDKTPRSAAQALLLAYDIALVPDENPVQTCK
jgi:hypothetical protein